MPRSSGEIATDIAAAEVRLRRLRAELREAEQSERQAVIDAFDAGKDIAEIAEQFGIRYSVVQGVLYRAGRTQGGRTAIRARMRAIGAESVSA